MQPIIRGYRPSDLDALYDICIRTADAGADLRGRFSDDRLMGDIYAAPYVTLEPGVARILDDGEGNAVGYILGTVDTPASVRSAWNLGRSTRHAAWPARLWTS